MFILLWEGWNYTPLLLGFSIKCVSCSMRFMHENVYQAVCIKTRRIFFFKTYSDSAHWCILFMKNGHLNSCLSLCVFVVCMIMWKSVSGSRALVGKFLKTWLHIMADHWPMRFGVGVTKPKKFLLLCYFFPNSQNSDYVHECGSYYM